MSSYDLHTASPDPSAARESLRQKAYNRYSQSLIWISSFAPRTFLILASLFGLYYLFFTPPFQVPDERVHFNRALGISSLSCVASYPTQIPKAVLEMEGAFPEMLELAPPIQHWVTLSSLTPWLAKRPSIRELAPFKNPNADLYSCVPYIPSATVIGLARMGNAPPLVLLYLGRLANLITFIALTYYALRALPDFHLFLLGLALMPMTLAQAASLSADATSIGACFFFTAYVLKIAFDEKVSSIRRTEFLTLAVAVVLTSLAKFNIWLILLVLLVPSSKFPSPAKRWAFVSALLLFACGSGLIWQYLNKSNVEVFSRLAAEGGADLAKNALFLRSHPGVVLSALKLTLHDFRFAYPTMFVGCLGYLMLPLPFAVVELYLGTLLVLALTQTWRIQLRPWHKALLAVAFVASFLSIFALLFTFGTTQSYLSLRILHGTGYINGVQGRYFIPIALPLLLLFSNRKIHIPAPVGLVTLVLVAGVANVTGQTSIWNTFYHDAAHRKYDNSIIQTHDGSVYLASNGFFRRIADPETLRILEVASRVRPATYRDLHSLPVGPPFPSLPGKVIQQTSNGAVFLIENGQKRHVPDPETLNAMNLGDQIRPVPQAVADAIPSGPSLPHLSRADAAHGQHSN